LIVAHIIPAAFARDMMAGAKHNFRGSIDKVHPEQHGIYDRNILCAKCDGKLGDYDGYAIDVCRIFDRKQSEFDGRFLMRHIDGDKLAKFVLAVLWRASVSTRSEFKNISLGLYESVARDVLFDTKPLKDFTAYELMIVRFKSSRIKVNRVIAFPTRMTGVAATVWGFTAGGFRFMAKIDERPWPSKLPNEMVVNGNDKLCGFVFDYERSSEHSIIVSMARADRVRRALSAAHQRDARPPKKPA
jgi:hypothetical protein